jgi:hypothetical protein
VVYWCNSYTIVHCSLDIIEWFKYKLKNIFKLYLILIHPPLSINTGVITIIISQMVSELKNFSEWLYHHGDMMKLEDPAMSGDVWKK